MKKRKTLTKKDGRSLVLARLRRENDRLRNALDRIANPIYWMRIEAEQQGAKLDGYMATQLAGSANYLRQIAERALKA